MYDLLFQSLLVENANIKAEVRKLRIENSELTKKATQACGNARHMEVTSLTHLECPNNLLTLEPSPCWTC